MFVYTILFTELAGVNGGSEDWTLPKSMLVLVSASAPLYLSIGTGLFSLYLYPALRSLGSSRLTFLCFLVPFLLVIDSIVALAVLGSSEALFELVHTEYVLQIVVRLSLNLLNALILHPSELPRFLARPAFGYQFQIRIIAALTVVAICSSIIDAMASFSSVIPSFVSLVGVLVPPLILVLFLRVAVVSRRWNSSPSTLSWDLLVLLQLPALAVSITRAWPTDTIISAASRFCLFIWTTGTLLSFSNLAPPSRSKSPKQYHPAVSVHPRRIQHTTVSEDFQSNRDPFAGPLAHQHRYQLPTLPDVGTYEYGEEPFTPRKQGAIRTQYSSESSTQWLLANPLVQAVPCFPPPVHLLSSTDVIVQTQTPLTAGSSVGPLLPLRYVAMAPVSVSRDRTPTQSLYIPGAPLESILGNTTEKASQSPAETNSLPSIPSFELDTPDQSFSSDVDTSTQTNDSNSLNATHDDSLPAVPVLPDTDEEKALKQDGETPRLSSVSLP